MPIILSIYTAILILALWQDAQGSQSPEDADGKC